jgi:hypothetical protein
MHCDSMSVPYSGTQQIFFVVSFWLETTFGRLAVLHYSVNYEIFNVGSVSMMLASADGD